MTPEREAQIISGALRREENKTVKDLEDAAAAGPDATIPDRAARIAEFVNRLQTVQQYLADVQELKTRFENPA